MKNKRVNWQELFSYIVFGVLTTVVNYIVYFGGRTLGLDYKVSNVIAWFFAILFAYITNKRYVFKQETKTKEETTKEMISFFGVRVFSLVIDMLAMFVLIELVGFNDFWAKTATQFIVVALNYVFSKVFVFKQKPSES